ncbi:MAG: PD-(D/E)XK nuclease family protein [Balneolales bacterium]
MTGLALHHSPAELYRFLVDRVKSVPEKKLILVRSQATKRFLVRELQKELNFFAPKIETLESWLDDLTTLSFEEPERPGLILSPDERVLVLEDWLRNHTKEAYRVFAGPQSVQAISNIIADLRRANIPLERLSNEIDEKSFFGTPHFAALLKDYQAFLLKNKRVDREQLPTLLKQPDPGLIPQDEIILYEPNYLFAGQKKGFEVVLDFCESAREKKITLIQFIPESADQENISVQLVDWFKNKARAIEYLMVENNNINTPSSLNGSPKPNRPLYTQTWHNPRTELDQTLRQICRNINQAKPGEHGSRCEDYVILGGDISRYEHFAKPLARRYDLPVYSSRGPSLISHPVVRRLLKLLRLIPEGFQIDDVYQIFADNQVRLPRLEHNVDSTPNIRSFSQFCRHYNLRTLSEADEQLNSIFDSQKSNVHNQAQTRGDFDEARELMKLENNRLFYQNVIKHLLAFKEKYTIDGIRPLKFWANHSRELLSMPENLFSSEANVVRSKMLDTLQEILETHDRLGLSPELDHDGFTDILKLSIEKQREKPKEHPEGILLTQAGYFSDTFGKTVFLLGMNEGGFPAGEHMDYLQFRYEEKLSGMLYQARPDNYLEARLELMRQLAGAKRLYISRPEHVNQKKVIGSSLWQDLLLEIEGNGKEKVLWPKESVNLQLCQSDVHEQLASNIFIQTSSLLNEHQPTHSQLVSAITNDRENPETMNCYDGILSGIEYPEYKNILSRQINNWWERNAPNDTVQTSISRLDEYASSPLDYFFNRVLRLSPPEIYRYEAESDIKGKLLHEILQAFYTADTAYATKNVQLVWPEDDPEAAQLRMKEITESLLEEYRNQLGYKDSPFPDILINNIQRITKWFLGYEPSLREALIEETGEMRPATMFRHPHFSMEYRWALLRDYGDIKARIIGVIDRIDVDEKSEMAIVYDYKTGAYGIDDFRKNINCGESFQLPIYALAVFDKGIDSFAGGYYSLPMNKSRKDVNAKYVIGDLNLFDASILQKKRSTTTMGIMGVQQLKHFLQKMENERLVWILRNLRKGTFNTSLSGQPKYSNFKWISRYDSKVQKERMNVEELRRLKTDHPNQLLRYYVPLEILPSN